MPCYVMLLFKEDKTLLYWRHVRCFHRFHSHCPPRIANWATILSIFMIIDTFVFKLINIVISAESLHLLCRSLLQWWEEGIPFSEPTTLVFTNDVDLEYSFSITFSHREEKLILSSPSCFLWTLYLFWKLYDEV